MSQAPVRSGVLRAASFSGWGLGAVTASTLFVAHHLLVLYASLAAEGLRPMPPLDVGGTESVSLDSLPTPRARDPGAVHWGNQGLRVDPEGSGVHTAVTDDQRALGEKRRRLVAQWLERAQGQFRSGRLTTPPGDNALETYRMLLAVVPGQAEALAGLEQIAERCVQLAEAAREPGNVEASLALIDQGLQAVPGHARLAQLRTALGSGQTEAIGSTRRLGGPSLPALIATEKEG